MPTKERITYLFNQCLSEAETASEREELNRYLADAKFQTDLELCLLNAFAAPKETKSLSADVENQILTAIHSTEKTVLGRKGLVRMLKWTAAAVACLFVTIPLVITTDIQEKIVRFGVAEQTHLESSVIDSAGQNIMPASESAILEMIDGTKLDLPKLAVGTQIVKNGLIVEKTAQSELALKFDKELIAGNKERSYHVIRTPRGGTYALTLPDGSKVHLNAETTLIIPSSFTDSTRSVELEGEAYFDIVKDRRLFKVRSSRSGEKQEVTVYGTAFNISAYPGTNQIETTLVRGSVHVQNLNNNHIIKLLPKQTAVFTNHKLYQVEANLDRNLSWLNDVFYFEDESIESIFKQIGRWYNVEFKGGSNLPEQHMWAQFSRTMKLNDLLAIMEQTFAIKFKVIGKEVYVVK